MKLGLFDAFLREMKESGRETWWIASRSELLFVKVDDYWGYETCHIDVLQRRERAGTCAWSRAICACVKVTVKVCAKYKIGINCISLEISLHVESCKPMWNLTSRYKMYAWRQYVPPLRSGETSHQRK